ncbi:Mitochondrial carrier protein [seawater metagenome]|uniref:Mitochondrial carrier protein n=1 Tax=seawater metagenome TaxID=1561972 RepID=A0A5E8CKH2_9ZZZZ
MNDYKAFLAGFMSGSIQTTFGHPFDTIKVLMQTNNFDKSKLRLRILYQGISFPLLSQSIVNSSLFGSFNLALDKGFPIYAAGGISGIVTGILLTPIELIKIRQQLNFSKNKIYKNPLLGLRYTIGREVIGNSIYFSSYNICKNNQLSILLSGGIAGCSAWAISYPLDIIKTRIQNGNILTFKQAIRQGNLYQGIMPCMCRAFVVNSIGFFCYEHFLNLID